ncbi:fatty acid desaturase [Yoonia sp.]|uniref:fatty acid desaturase n=1 Tax=Yoonia sp. TaxID=2212373 RepID=UPI002DFAA27F|nr:fatty acid desaturase [Yoonia sp.]
MDRNDWAPIGTDVVSRKDLKQYMTRNNKTGLVHFMLHIASIVGVGTLLWLTAFSWWTVPVMFAQGAMIAFLFAPMHECVHSSAFKTRRLNIIVGRISAVIIMRPFLYLKYRHMAHHTFTQHPEGDPDRVDFPRDMSEYLFHVSSANIWLRMIKNLTNLSLGRFTKEEREFIPEGELSAVANEARLMVGLYLLIAVASLWFQSWLAIYVWVLPRILGEPALRAIRMIEHTGMEESPNMLENTRTTHTNFLVRFFYWNMPYHAEHHLYPSVPFHALPRLHEEKVGAHLSEIAPSVLSVHYKILKRLLGRATPPHKSAV